MEYITRVIDTEIDIRSQVFNAINILGPKGCGKTRTARERCRTVIEFQDEDERERYLNIAEIQPSLFLDNEKPILFDEWQDAPKIWGTIRKACDDTPGECGSYYLTGSSSKKLETAHTGTGRISTLIMYPMTLYETGDSNGSISISELVKSENYETDGQKSNIGLRDLFYIVCRGGWPRCMELADNNLKLKVAKDYYNQIYSRDISAVDGINRNGELTKSILWSYARNMATQAKKSSIYRDIKSNHDVSDNTISSYIDALEKLFVLKDIDAWTPQVRSKTSIRAAKKHIFVDPSIGIAALGLSPDYFKMDLDTFGHVFENLVLRDLIAYADVHGATIKHYSDSMGLEIDAVYQAADGKYALIEIKTGDNAVPAAEKNLLKFKEVIKSHNEKAMKNEERPGVLFREPSQLIVICANSSMAYTTSNGVKVIPIGCLRD